MNVLIATNKQKNLYKNIGQSIKDALSKPLTEEEQIEKFEGFLKHMHHHHIALNSEFKGFEPGEINIFNTPTISISHKTNFPFSLELLSMAPVSSKTKAINNTQELIDRYINNKYYERWIKI